MREQKLFCKQLSLTTACMMFPDQMQDLARDLLDDADDADEIREKINGTVDELFPGGCPEAEYHYRVLEYWKVKHGIAFYTTREGDRIVWRPRSTFEGAHEYTAEDGWQPYEDRLDEEPVEHVTATPAPPPGPFKTLIVGPWPYAIQ